jgi:hypothetical protein
MIFRCTGFSRLAPDTSSLRHPTGRLWSAVITALLITLMCGPADAKGKSRGKGKGKGKPTAAAKKSPSPSNEEIVAGHRAAVFAFDGEDTYSVRDHVVQALKDRGLQIETSLRAVDTAEQFRDMGATLNISVYVHGKVKQLPADRSTATIVVRSAVSGHKLTTVTFNGFRRGLPYDVEEKLWDKVGPVVARACTEASKPGRRHNKPMMIEAGTPL